jgi:radical SAM superfamily enzyme YgiQ (UPF0313 family)
MTIAFIKPNMIAGSPGDAMEPLVFGLLSALTPPEIPRRLYDERLAPIPFESPADLVAITADTFTAKRAYQIADIYRRQHVPVVLGGFHASLCPDEARRHVDAVVIGDAEDTWPRILADVSRGALRPVYRSTLPTPGHVQPDTSCFESKAYRSLHLLEYNRGCRHACEFCSIQAMYRSHIRRRPVDAVAADIERNRKRHLFFVDDNLYADETSLRAMLNVLKRQSVHWSCQISPDVTRNPQLVALMAEAGCVSVTVGIESLNRKNLDQMGKSWIQDDLRTAIRQFQDHGIMVYGTFVIGYDFDTPDVFDRTLDFALDTRLLLANFNPLTPTPGTRLYTRLRAEGRMLFDRWWLDADYRYGDAVFRPRGMSPDELRDGCFRIRRAFNRPGSILSRFPGASYRRTSPFRAALFLAANVVSRREIYRKQGQPLGALPPGRGLACEEGDTAASTGATIEQRSEAKPSCISR